MEKELSTTSQITRNLLRSLKDNNIEELRDSINALFSSIPAEIFIKNREAYYHSLIYLIIKMIGVYIDAEISMKKGRTDAVIKTDDYLYVLEFKMLPKTSEDAINQIKEKGYHEPYTTDKRQKFMIGISFDADSKTFQDFLVEEF